MKIHIVKSLFALAAVLTALLTAGCGDTAAPAEKNDRMLLAGGIPPAAWLVQRIGGDRVQTVSLLPQGKNPHDYAPGAREVAAVMKAAAFFSTGTTFEELAARPLQRSVEVVPLAHGVPRIPLESGCSHTEKEHQHKDCSGKGHHHHHHGHGDTCSADGLDPHIWLSIPNLKIMAETVCRTLCRLDADGAAYYRQNLAALTGELDVLEKKITAAFAPWRGRTFFVYHPAFGYFAAMTGLRQVAIELGGREASAARLAEVIRMAKQEKAAAIFVQPQFNPASADALARATGAEVRELDPLAGDVISSLNVLTGSLLKGFTAGAEAKGK